MARASIYEHFHPDEHHFVDKALEWVNRVVRYHEERLTDFLDPRQRHILQTIVNREPDAQAVFFGGYAEAERTRARIAPAYAVLEGADFDIRVLSITSEDSRFSGLAHGDFLGAALGLGIKREKIGDIHVGEHQCHMLAAGAIGEFLHLHLQAVNRVKVMTELLPLDKLITVEPRLEELSFTAASLRLDSIVSDVVRLSRAKVLQPIKAGKCRVNWAVVEDPSFRLKAGDVVSLQGFGRFKLLDAEGVTRSGRYRIRVGRYI